MKMQLKGLRALEDMDAEAAVENLSTAFSSDASTKFILNSDAPRLADVRSFYKLTVRLGIDYGQAFSVGDNSEGVCMWLPPGRAEITPLMFFRSGGLRLGFDIDMKIYSRFIAYSNYSSGIHKKHAPFPHWYLLCIGVKKTHQGLGLSGKLMRPAMDYFDKAGQASYLETHNERNVSFYEKYGYRVVEVGQLPGTGAAQWCMLRDPQPARITLSPALSSVA